MFYWQVFWTIWLLIAGVSFAFITIVVTLKGFAGLREMFTGLGEQQTEEKEREQLHGPIE
jgi:hypothetical protein